MYCLFALHILTLLHFPALHFLCRNLQSCRTLQSCLFYLLQFSLCRIFMSAFSVAAHEHRVGGRDVRRQKRLRDSESLAEAGADDRRIG